MTMSSTVEDSAVTNFRKYLRIETVQPNPNYEEAKEYLKVQAAELGLPFQAVETDTGKYFCIMTWLGSDESLPSIMLHSHIDVVPVFKEHWIVDPFSAEKIDGNIYARGAQDMKCVGIQYIEAVRRLKKAGKQFLRTIHLTFSPDEEIGSTGMKQFVDTNVFKKMNVGFSLDEGIANPGKEFRVFYAERSIWWVYVTCPGSPGHGSAFIKNSAAEKFQKVINKFLQFRCKQEKRLEEDPSLQLGDVTTVNLTIVKGGVQPNVIPSELTACFDIRVPPSVDMTNFEAQIHKWCKESGDGVGVQFELKGSNQEITSTDPDDKWWKAFTSACDRQKIKLQKEIFPAGTDSRYIRKCGLPASGFSPMNNTPILLHDHNEFLNENIFLRGIEIYEEIIPSLANVK